MDTSLLANKHEPSVFLVEAAGDYLTPNPSPKDLRLKAQGGEGRTYS
jgi:hypothetical protein